MLWAGRRETAKHDGASEAGPVGSPSGRSWGEPTCTHGSNPRGNDVTKARRFGKHRWHPRAAPAPFS